MKGCDSVHSDSCPLPSREEHEGVERLAAFVLAVQHQHPGRRTAPVGKDPFRHDVAQCAIDGETEKMADQIDAVFAQNDEMILGAIDAAKEAGRADRIVFVGFDAIDDAITALENGELSATIAQQPKEMGRLGVESAMEYLGGEDVSSFIAVDLALITR